MENDVQEAARLATAKLEFMAVESTRYLNSRDRYRAAIERALRGLEVKEYRAVKQVLSDALNPYK